MLVKTWLCPAAKYHDYEKFMKISRYTKKKNIIISVKNCGPIFNFGQVASTRTFVGINTLSTLSKYTYVKNQQQKTHTE